MRKRLVLNNGKAEWVETDVDIKVNPRVKGEDLSVDSYINKYGGIKSMKDDKVYTTKGAYMDHIKAHNLTIKDWR